MEPITLELKQFWKENREKILKIYDACNTRGQLGKFSIENHDNYGEEHLQAERNGGIKALAVMRLQLRRGFQDHDIEVDPKKKKSKERDVSIDPYA